MLVLVDLLLRDEPYGRPGTIRRIQLCSDLDPSVLKGKLVQSPDASSMIRAVIPSRCIFIHYTSQQNLAILKLHRLRIDSTCITRPVVSNFTPCIPVCLCFREVIQQSFRGIETYFAPMGGIKGALIEFILPDQLPFRRIVSPFFFLDKDL